MSEEGTILDVGSGGSFFPLLLALQGYDVTAVDSHPFDYGFDSYKFTQGDTAIIKLPQKYDRIMSISALEHFGLQQKVPDLLHDFKTVDNLTKYLRDDGLWLVTIPFGKDVIWTGTRIYTQERIDELFPRIVKQEYFVRENGIWLKTTREETEDVVHIKGEGDLTVTCLVAKK